MSDALNQLHDRIDHDFALHPPRSEGVAVHLDAARDTFRLCAHQIVTIAGAPSRELSLALTHLEQAQMFATAAIARHQPDTTPVAQVDTLGDDPVTRIHKES